MLPSLLRNILGRRGPGGPQDMRAAPAGMLRLHVGGETPHSDWKILNVQAGPHVDFVGSCTDLSQFAAGSVAEIYASHVLEHLGYLQELPAALAECYRALASGGRFYASVPDLEVLARLYLDPALSVEDRFHVMRMMYGGQVDGHDYHHVGLNWDLLRRYLLDAGFREIRRLERLGVFDDTSNSVFHGRLISLNVIATK
jgi:predicted SAM-dependent methyltransferase